METSLKTVFAQIFSCCPKNLSCPDIGGGGQPPPSPPCPYVYDAVLWEGHSETPDKEILSLVAKFYKIDGEIIGKAEQKMYPSFRGVRGLGYMTVPEMLETMHENDILDICFQCFLMW